MFKKLNLKPLVSDLWPPTGYIVNYQWRRLRPGDQLTPREWIIVTWNPACLLNWRCCELWNQYRVGLRFMLLWCFSQLKQNVTYFRWDTVYFGITAVEKLMIKLKLLSAYMRLIQTADIVLRRFTFSFYALIIYSWLILYMLRYWRGYLSEMICILSSWCHCHPMMSCSSKIQNGLPFWCRLTRLSWKKDH